MPFAFGANNSERLTEREAYDTTKISAKADDGRKDMELIQFHYDVSNKFYGLFLDPEMVYSSAYFQDDNTTLEEAQIFKLDMICKKLRLEEGRPPA